MIFSEFLDGNVPAGYDLLRPFKQTLELVPAGVNMVCLRSPPHEGGAILVDQLAGSRDGARHAAFCSACWGARVERADF